MQNTEEKPLTIKVRKKPGPRPRALKPLMRKAQLTMREALLESQPELSCHMQALMLNIVSDKRSIKYKPREQIAALELIARILGQMAPTENVIMPIPPDQLRKRLEDIYQKIRGAQKGAVETPLLADPGAPDGGSSLSSLSTDQAFEAEVEVVDVSGGGNYD
jgi:hypothetical protein